MRVEFERTKAWRAPDADRILAHPVIVFDDPDTDGFLYGYTLKILSLIQGKDGRPCVQISRRGKWAFLVRHMVEVPVSLHRAVLSAWERSGHASRDRVEVRETDMAGMTPLELAYNKLRHGLTLTDEEAALITYNDPGLYDPKTAAGTHATADYLKLASPAESLPTDR